MIRVSFKYSVLKLHNVIILLHNNLKHCPTHICVTSPSKHLHVIISCNEYGDIPSAFLGIVLFYISYIDSKVSFDTETWHIDGLTILFFH